MRYALHHSIDCVFLLVRTGGVRIFDESLKQLCNLIFSKFAGEIRIKRIPGPELVTLLTKSIPTSRGSRRLSSF
jgi:hypothetical protein